MREYKRLALATAVAVAPGVLSACIADANPRTAGGLEENIAPRAEVKAPENTFASFLPQVVLPPAPGGVGHYHLVVSKDTLEKEYLLHASVIPQTGAPTSSGLMARVVAFKKKGDKVFLMEAVQGHVVTTDLPAQLILAEFDVVSETDEAVVIDFNGGMKNLLVAGNWYASDFYGKRYDGVEPFMSMEVGSSFVSEIRNDGTQVEIRQIAQVRREFAYQALTYVGTYEMRYYLQPYNPDPTFVPKETSKFERVGYFEVAPRFETEAGSGRRTTKISKWNTDETVTFHVSPNTPPEFVRAVRDGIEYWNKAFGKEVLRSAVAPEGVSAPDSRYNIVQWVPWDNAGFAYADALMDPRSGEILHAQSYLTSVFAFASKLRARRLLHHLKTSLDVEASLEVNGGATGYESPHPHDLFKTNQLQLNFAAPSRLCDLDVTRNLVEDLERLLAKDASDEAILRVSQAYVRQVVAHEVGHTLGLRHNFAGSLASNIDLGRRDEIFAGILARGEVPDPRDNVVSSSVMDYLDFVDDVIVGLQMGNMDHALSYDVQAIRWGYEEREISRNTAVLFCTDSQVSTFGDCRRHDSGSSPVAYPLWKIDQTLSTIPMQLVDAFVEAKYPYDPRDSIEVDEVALKPAYLGNTISQSLMGALDWFGEDIRSLKIERSFSAIGPMNEDEVRAAQGAWVLEQFGELGGVTASLLALLPTEDSNDPFKLAESRAKLDRYLDERQAGTSLSGDEYRLANDEVAHIRSQGHLFLKMAEPTALDAVVAAVAGTTFRLQEEEDNALAETEATLAAASRHMIMAQTEIEVEGLAAYLASVETTNAAIRACKAAVVTGADSENEGTTGDGESDGGTEAGSEGVGVDSGSGSEDLSEGCDKRAERSLVVPDVARLKKFHFDQKARASDARISVRKNAAGLIQQDMADVPGFNFTEKKTLEEDFKGLLEGALGQSVEDAAEGGLSGPFKDWLSDQEAVLKALSAEKE